MTILEPIQSLREAVSPEAEVGRFAGREAKSNAANSQPEPPQFEQPWHTLAARCLALKMTQEETATYCEVSSASVRLALRAPFFQLRLREELNRVGTPLLELFQDAGVRAFNKIVEVMEDAKSPKSVVLASAKEVIDRCLGKAPQTIKHEDTSVLGDPVALVEQLKQQNASLREQLPN